LFAGDAYIPYAHACMHEGSECLSPTVESGSALPVCCALCSC